MIGWAEVQFRKTRAVGGGGAEGDHSEALGRIRAKLGGAGSGKQPEIVESESFPDAIGYVWAWFSEIVAGAKSDGMGPSTIGWADLAAWCELTEQVVEPWEARLLIQLSMLRAAVLSEASTNGHQLKV